ncbi:MAG TPA: glycosyltransferase [Planctomycetota bacterium]|jgi:glycosyltransferase involved in cell wall biosynthesis|nr:glycosyltransferase [Planctomycetota bacterium]
MSSPSLDISLIVIASTSEPDLNLFRDMMATWRRELEALRRSYEVLVVDDGFGDPFLLEAKRIAKDWKEVRVVCFRRNFGESVALDAAVEVARGRSIVTSTWYLQVDPSGLRQSIQLLDEGTDYVAVRRDQRIDGVLSRAISWGFNALTRWMTKVKIYDLNCSFRAFKKSVNEELSYHGDLFRFLSVLAVRKGFRVKEIPLKHVREMGPSTLLRPGLFVRRLLDIFTLFFLIKFTRKPLRFFGLIGALFFLAGTAISSWVLYQRLFQGEALADRPMLILGIFLVVLGIIVASIGLIGEIIIFTNGRQIRDYHIDSIIEGGQGGESSDA